MAALDPSRSDAVTLDDTRAHSLAEALDAAAGSQSVLVPAGGLMSARDANQAVHFLRTIAADSALGWKTQVRFWAQAARPMVNNGSRSLYWQIGNEINSRHYSRAVRLFNGQTAGSRSNDEAIIPIYAEYYLAPTVEALRDSDWGSELAKKRVAIVLGSIANSADPVSREWLNDLLHYTLEGKYAPTLAGARVADVVDIASIHYLLTAADVSWMQVLDSLYERWIAGGTLRGIWSTEELGRYRAERELGAVTALKVTGRYLHWWLSRHLTPLDSRCYFWGWGIGTPGTRAADAMSLLHETINEHSLKDLSRDLRGFPVEEWETYAFEVQPEGQRRLIVVLPAAGTDGGTIRGFDMVAGNWSGEIDATAHLFSPEGHTRLAASGRVRNGTLNVRSLQPLHLAGDAAAVIFLRVHTEAG